MRRTQIYLDDDQDARLARRARSAGVTKSAVIREAIDAFLSGAADEPERLERALSETAGALPDLAVPLRDEWERGYG